MTGRHAPLAERYWAKVARRDDTDCWLWTAYVNPAGYGMLGTTGAQVRLAHRIGWELANGPIPDGLSIDHTCHNGSGCIGGPGCRHRRCQNPRHLEAVEKELNDRRGNNGRQTECPHGHPYTPENTITDRKKNGRPIRRCRTCRNNYKQRFRQAVKTRWIPSEEMETAP